MTNRKYAKGVRSPAKENRAELFGMHAKILADWFKYNKPEVKLRNIKFTNSFHPHPYMRGMCQETIMEIYDN